VAVLLVSGVFLNKSVVWIFCVVLLLNCSIFLRGSI
jgi:hypothetical protein